MSECKHYAEKNTALPRACANCSLWFRVECLEFVERDSWLRVKEKALIR